MLFAQFAKWGMSPIQILNEPFRFDKPYVRHEITGQLEDFIEKTSVSLSQYQCHNNPDRHQQERSL